MGQNVVSGIGASLHANRKHVKDKRLAYNETIPLESRDIALASDVPEDRIAVDECVSLKDGRIIPLDEAHPFHGIAQGFSAGSHNSVIVTVAIRGAVHLRLAHRPHDSVGKTVYLDQSGSESFNVEGRGVAIGKVLFIQPDRENEVIVGFKSTRDSRELIPEGATGRF